MPPPANESPRADGRHLRSQRTKQKIIEAYLDLLRENPHSQFLFLSERKAPLPIDGDQKLVERLGEAAGFKFPIHLHMLRHAAGYALAGRGVDTRTLQAFIERESHSLGDQSQDLTTVATRTLAIIRGDRFQPERLLPCST